jgi:ribosome-associated protein
MERLVELIDKACQRPTPRRATRPTAGSQKRRLEAKKRRGAIKDGRRTHEPSDE